MIENKHNKFITVIEKDGIEYVTMSKKWFAIRMQAVHSNGMLDAYQNIRNIIKK